MPSPVFQSNITSSYGRFLTTESDRFRPGEITLTDIEDDLCGNRNIKIYTGPESCKPYDPLFAIAEIQDPGYKIEEVSYENKFGEKFLKSRVVVPTMSVKFTAEVSVKHILYRMVSENESLRIDFESTWINRRITQLVVQEEQIDLKRGKLYYITFTFQVPDNIPITGTMPCCAENVYSEAPYVEPCDEEGGGGGGGGDSEECELMSANLSEDSGNINLTVDNPFGTITNQWSFTPIGGGASSILGNNISSATPPGYGTITVIVRSGTCKKTATFLYSDPCTGFLVTGSKVGGVMTAAVPVMFTPVVWTIEYSLDGVSYAPAGAADTLVATDSGYYKFKAVKDDCEDEFIFEVTEDDLCIIEGSLSAEGNVISFSDPDDDFTYQWKYRGNGILIPVIIDGATEATYEATENGVYILEITDGDCTVPFDYVHSVCTDCATFDAEVTNVGDLITAAAEGCAEPTFDWFIMEESGLFAALDEHEDTFELPEEGFVFAVKICCPGCDPVYFTIIRTSDGIKITKGGLITGGAWGGLNDV